MPTIQVHDQELFYTWAPVAGSSGPCLLFTHGLGSSSSFFATVIPALVARGYPCLAFDTPGSALSKYKGRDSDMDATCGAVLALIALLELDAKRIIVVGHSLGAIVASEVSLHLGLLGTVLIGPVNPSAALAEVFTARLQLLEKEGMEGIANVVPLAATGPGATATQQAFIRALLLAQSPEGYASLCRMIINAQRPRYEDIKCPLLIITGSHDETAPMSGSQQILRSWGVDSNLKRIAVLQNVGHWHCIEAADKVEALVSEFIQGVQVVTGARVVTGNS